MKTLVIYDSNYGNTKIVAEKIAEVLKCPPVHIDAVSEESLSGVALLIVGSPINGWNPTVKVQNFLTSLKSGQLDSCKVAAFDTRVTSFMHGDAAKKIARSLKLAGATLLMPPQGFNVQGTEGPLVEGELLKAESWAKEILTKI